MTIFRACAWLLAPICSVGFFANPEPAQAGVYKVVYAFQGGGDGAGPANSLLKLGDMLYGTTSSGGGSANCSGGCGTVFSLDPKTGVEQVEYSFQGGNDGAAPYSGLVEAGGALYGVTYEGGGSANCSDGCGTVFSVNPTTGAEQVIYSFQNNPDGANPIGSVIDVAGTLYGTTQLGGVGYGAVFALNLQTGEEYSAHIFDDGFDGAFPYAGLIDVGGALWGTTEYGGGVQNCDGSGCGTVFFLNPVSLLEGAVPLFGGSNAAYPTASVIHAGSSLYGTSTAGGASGYGTVFSVQTKDSDESVVYSFQGGNDGAWPGPGLLKIGSLLYGVTFYGGGSTNCTAGLGGCGTLYSVNPKTGVEQVLHAFQAGSDGAAPGAALIKVGKTLYGTTAGGGPSGNGTVFAYTP